MPLVNEYKKCLKCGDKYRIESTRTKCLCGGHLYTVGAIYQPKIQKVAVAPAQLQYDC